MTANALPKTASRHFRNGIPALVIGILTLLLIGYGTLIQPSRMKRWYQAQQTAVSSGFSHAVAADNSDRSVQSALEAARRGLIVHQRLLQMDKNSPQARISASIYLTDVVTNFQSWLQADQGFISEPQRELINQLCSEFTEESKSNLLSLLKEDSSVRAQALKLIASSFSLRCTLTQAQMTDLRSALKEASDQLPSDTELAILSAELEIESSSGAITTETQQNLDQLAERFGSDRRLRAILVLATKSLSQNPKLAVRLVEKALSDKSIADSGDGLSEQLALIKAHAIVANWSEVNLALPRLINKSMTSQERHYLTSLVAQYFEMLLASDLPVEVSVWCERSDACQNLILQLNPNSLMTCRRLMSFAESGKDNANCLSQTLTASNLFPLKGVVKLLSTSSDDVSNAERSNSDWTMAATITSQICLAAVQTDRANALQPAMLASRLTEQFPSNGNVWYVDAIVKAIQGESQKALPSAKKAQELLGDLPSIRSLLQELGVQTTAVPK